MLTMGSAEHKVRVDSERNQGRAPDMDWLDHDRLGFNYRLSDLACALGIAQLERLGDLLAARARVAGVYGGGPGAVGRAGAPCPGPRGGPGGGVGVLRAPPARGR